MKKSRFTPKIITDGVFIYLFGYEKNIKFTEYLLECLFNKEKGYFHNKITARNSVELNKNGLLKRTLVEDIEIVFDNKMIINIEPYTYFDKHSVTKSFLYANSDYSNQFDAGNDLKDPKLFIQYNIIKETKYNTGKYAMANINDARIRLLPELESFLIILINLKDIDNLDISEKGKRLLKFIRANNMQEAKYLAKGDKILMKIFNEADMFVRSNNRQLEIIDELYRKAESYEEGYSAGESKGLSRGLSQGLNQGINQGIQKVASNMLKSGSTKEYVCEVTGLTEKEIDTIKL